MRIPSFLHGAAAATGLLPAGPQTGDHDLRGTSGGLEGLLRDRLLSGRYRVLDVVGRGGSGVVYRGRDEQLGREVAIKVLARGLSEPGSGHSYARARFEKEARAVAGIRHPNVVTVHDRGIDPELGIDFIVMEMLEGLTVRDSVQRHGCPGPRAILKLMREAAAGVAAGHRAGLVHRDIKPANLFLDSSGRVAQLKVLDFGISEEDRDSALTVASRGGETLYALSPAFASPEQLVGDDWLTPASDVFSIGAVAFHLLLGERIWESLDPRRAVLEMEQKREKLRRDRRLPLGFREVLIRALASHPEDRFPDARALLIALDAVNLGDMPAILRDEPASSEPDEDSPPPAVPPVGNVQAVAQPSPAPHPVAAQRAGSTPDAGRSGHPAVDDGSGPMEWEVALISWLGTVAIVFGLGAIAILLLAAGHWDALAAGAGSLAAMSMLFDRRPHSHSIDRARLALVGLAGLALVGGTVVRAVQGSIPDLLFLQILLSVAVPQLTLGRASRTAEPAISVVSAGEPPRTLAA